MKGFVICFCFRSRRHPVPSLLFQAIEGEAIYFIDQSFTTLRSASVAFDTLLKFKHIRSREALNNQMMMKFNDITVQYCKEVRKHLKHLALEATRIKFCDQPRRVQCHKSRDVRKIAFLVLHEANLANQ